MVDITVLENIDLFKDIPLNQLRTLSCNFTKCSYEKNQSIYCEGESDGAFYVVVTGKIKLCKNIEEKLIHIRHLSNGDFFGICDIFFEHNFINAVATEKSELIRIGKQDFKKYALKIPELLVVLLQELSSIVRGGLQIAYMSGKNKIKYFLACYADKFGKIHKDKVLIEKNFTYENVSRLLNLSREYTTKTFHELEQKKIIEINKTVLKIDKSKIDLFINSARDKTLRHFFCL
jgi:CRP/FNR family transcriptional regulator